MFTWTLVVSAVVGCWRCRNGRTRRPILGSGRHRLAFAIELVIAILFPGPTNASVAIPYGLGISVLGLVIAWLLSPACAGSSTGLPC
jgi:hypothetical protein